MLKVFWTKHARERQMQWEKKKGITRKDVEDVVMTPEQDWRGGDNADSV